MIIGTRPNKVTQGHISQFHRVMCRERRQHFFFALNIFCSIWNTFITKFFVRHETFLAHVSTGFHHTKNNNIASFRTFERCSRSKKWKGLIRRIEHIICNCGKEVNATYRNIQRNLPFQQKIDFRQHLWAFHHFWKWCQWTGRQ